MGGLGAQLRAAREAQGLTLADVAERTHIRDVYLSALERDDYEALPPRIYVEGMVRRYGSCLGLNPEAVAGLLSETLGPSAGPDIRPHLRGLGGDAPGPGRSITAVVVLLAVLALMGVGLLLWRAEASPEINRAEPSAPGVQMPLNRQTLSPDAAQELLFILRAGLRIGVRSD